MKKQIAKTNIHNLKVGETLKFKRADGFILTFSVDRVEEKSVYTNSRTYRDSWGTFNGYFEKWELLSRT